MGGAFYCKQRVFPNGEILYFPTDEIPYFSNPKYSDDLIHLLKEE